MSRIDEQKEPDPTKQTPTTRQMPRIVVARAAMFGHRYISYQSEPNIAVKEGHVVNQSILSC